MDYRLPEADKLFPPVKVGPRELSQWRQHPRTEDLIQEVRRRLYNLGAEALKGTVDDFSIRKGEAKAYNDLLGWLDISEDEILGKIKTEDIDE